MPSLRRIIMVALLLGGCFQLTAQGRRSDVESRLLIKAGFNTANITVTPSGAVDKANQLSSFHFGLISDLPFNKYISFQGGLIYTGKGANTEGTVLGNRFKANTNPMYIEMPLNLVGKLPLGSKHIKLILGAGPYGAIGITGMNKTQVTTPLETIYSNKEIEYESNTTPANAVGYPNVKRFDYGINAQAGLELRRLVFTIGYDYGFGKLAPGTDNNADESGKNRVLMLSAAIML